MIKFSARLLHGLRCSFCGSPGVDRMLVFTLAGPSLVYVRRTAAQLILNNELRLKWGANWDSVGTLSKGIPAKNCL